MLGLIWVSTFWNCSMLLYHACCLYSCRYSAITVTQDAIWFWHQLQHVILRYKADHRYLLKMEKKVVQVALYCLSAQYNRNHISIPLAAGDETTWNAEDWAWDSKTFTAVPTESYDERSAKRHCGGLVQMDGLMNPPTFVGQATDSTSAYTHFPPAPLYPIQPSLVWFY